MDEKLMQAISQYFEMQVAKEQAEAQKAAAEKAPKYVTLDDLKNALGEFATQQTEAMKALVTEAIENSAPVRPEGAGRAGEPGEAQKAADVDPVTALGKKPLDQLTAEDKEMKARLIAHVAVKGMK